MVYKKFLILSFSFFFKTINFLEKNFGSWWPTLSLMACIISGIGVTRYRVVSHRNSCTLWQKYKKAFTFELAKKKKSKILLARATPWPGQWPGDDLGNDRGNNLGVMETKKIYGKKMENKKDTKRKKGMLCPSQKWKPVEKEDHETGIHDASLKISIMNVWII